MEVGITSIVLCSERYAQKHFVPSIFEIKILVQYF